MTATEIRRRLGLKPFWKHFKDTVARLSADELGDEHAWEQRLRQTGRTTKMLCNALAVVSTGNPVRIEGYSHHYTRQLNFDAMIHATKLGLDTRLIQTFARNPEDAQVFLDHTCFERRA